jgi:hypothetical protein
MGSDQLRQNPGLLRSYCAPTKKLVSRALELLVRRCRTTARPGIDSPARYLAMNRARELVLRALELLQLGCPSTARSVTYLARVPPAMELGRADARMFGETVPIEQLTNVRKIHTLAPKVPITRAGEVLQLPCPSTARPGTI